MTTESLNIDSLLRQSGGCDRFQIAITSVCLIPYVTSAFSSIFMAYGNYNPGWRCLDNTTKTSDTALYHKDNPAYELEYNRSSLYWTDSCNGYDSCQNVEFNPDASTVATEWGLVCNKAWISSSIIAIQFGGLTLGSFFTGYIGDHYGRKPGLYIGLLVHAVLNLVSVFSTSWQMFAVIRFFIGSACAMIFGLCVVYTTEYVTPKWRIIIPSMPMWCIGCVLLSIGAILFKDWKYLHVFNSVFSILCIIPAFIFPESLRWLIVNEKEKRSLKALSQVSRMNKMAVPDENCLALLKTHKEQRSKNETKKGLSFLRLFGKSSRIHSLVLGFQFISSNIVYVATSFGVAALPGNIYVNNLIMYTTELPGNFIAWFGPNIFGRKPSAILFCVVESCALFVFVAFDFVAEGTLRVMGMLIMTIVARISTDVIWYVMAAYISELYPTTIRSTASGWMMFTAGVGAAIAPYVIPVEEEALYISYLSMAVLSLFCAFAVLLLPETSGKDLDDDEKSSKNTSTVV